MAYPYSHPSEVRVLSQHFGDPEARTLLQVKLDESNAHEAERMFTILMGDVVEPRKHFIEENALNVRNLDV